MKLKVFLVLTLSYLIVFFMGFATGIYTLPLLIEPDSPSTEQIERKNKTALYQGEFIKDLQDSDALHWGEGIVKIGKNHVSFQGKLAPGPDYKLYFSPVFVETEADFAANKSKMINAANIDTFSNFLVKLPNDLDPSQYKAIIIWCESFGEFITATRYDQI